MAGERTLQRVGDDLVHYDIWGGNICFQGDRPLLVDWGAAVRGDRRIDLAYALFTIRVEDGRAVAVDFPEEGAYAAEIAVSMALQALEPLPAWAPAGFDAAPGSGRSGRAGAGVGGREARPALAASG